MPLADVVVEDDGSPSWAAWGALTAAAVAGVAIGRAGTTVRESAADEYSQELVRLDRAKSGRWKSFILIYCDLIVYRSVSNLIEDLKPTFLKY